MNIFEEYLQRNDIKIPIVRHTNFGILILRADKDIWNHNWFVFSIEWQSNSYHPGNYNIQMRSTGFHSKNQNLSCLLKCHSSFEKTWSDYEQFIHSWIKKANGLEPIIEEKEAILSAWEIFIFINEHWFFRQSIDLKRKLFQSIDLEISVDHRYENHIIFCETEEFKRSDISSTWNNNFLREIKYNYLTWLGLLMKDYKK
jgi:hypothetical protein